MASEIEILQILHMVGMAYPSARIAESTLTVYITLLSDLSAELIHASACEHIARSNFFPTIAELRDGVFGMNKRLSPVPDAHAAWAEVQAEIVRIGQRGEPCFSHALIADIVDLFGWRYLCLSENSISDRSHFVQAYQARLTDAHTAARMLPQTRQLLRELGNPVLRKEDGNVQ